MPTVVEIIADSLNPQNKRLTTFIITAPRWILAEINTHKMASKNVSSSRAIPINKMIEIIENDTAFPSEWGANQSGMQSGQLLSLDQEVAAREAWLEARDNAIMSAKKLSEIGLHKQWTNRLIENFSYIRAVISGTDWENFFRLRAHSDAQPEFRVLAFKMLDAYNKSKPKSLKVGEWHLPFCQNIDENRLKSVIEKFSGFNYEETNELRNEFLIKICVARCARTSFFNNEGRDDYEADIKLCDRLFGSVPKHLSPTEHVAQCLDSSEYFGNFCGFKQYRKFLSEENLTDDRVIKHKYELL